MVAATEDRDEEAQVTTLTAVKVTAAQVGKALGKKGNMGNKEKKVAEKGAP